jgi:hypothetical protein
VTSSPTPRKPRSWLIVGRTALLGWACLANAHLNASDADTPTTGLVVGRAALENVRPPPPAEQAPLQLDLPPVRLPTAVVGRSYSYVFKASGGQPPYHYEAKGAPLPEGLALDGQGRLSGTAKVAKTYPVTIGVTDAWQSKVQQNFSLGVVSPSPAKAASVPAALASAASNPTASLLKPLPPDDAQALVPVPRSPQLDVFKLQAATLALLVPTPGPAEEAVQRLAAAKQNEEDRANGVLVEASEPTRAASAPSTQAIEPPPAPGPLEAPQIAQLIQLLSPLLNVEYPNQQLFEAALDAQLCQFTAELLRASAAKQHATPPSKLEFAKACPPPDWGRLLRQAQAERARILSSTASPMPALAVSPGISWPDLAPSILPAELRAWLVQSSRTTRMLRLDKKIDWDGAGCGCVPEEIRSQIYGFFPLWWATGTPQKVDFSRLTRASVFAVAINDDGSLAPSEHLEPGYNDFIQQARVHGTALDLTLYRNDWQFLNNPDTKAREAIIQRMVRQLPAQARGLMDRTLSDWQSRLFGVLPGLNSAAHMADGITLYFDHLPPVQDRVARERFDSFYKQLVEAFIATLRRGPNSYTLNLVMSDQDIDTPGAFALDRLYDYLRQAENPTLLHGRIQSDGVHYTSNTNLTLRFIVTLSEPTSDSKKVLRAKLDMTNAVKGGDRRIVLRKLIALVSPRSLGGQQFGDDLVYYEDNFGGVALWPMPIEGLSTPADYDQNFDTAFLSTAVSPLYLAVRGFVCEYRWYLRAAFDLLLLVGAICGLAMAANCAWRSRWGRYMPLGALPPLAIGALLFSFDPALKPLRESSFLAWTLIAIVTIWAVLAMRRTHVESP